MKSAPRKNSLVKKINLNRRNFLKLLLLGAGAFLLGKSLISVISFLSRSGLDSKKEFKNFEVIDAGKEVIFRDIKGEDILIIEKGALK